ncbi:MAG TPA: helix-turn-helix domain-containing protein [Haliangium sp.]|nr:helix-turn-helix domain-containing protein [Haliangium sp.]
MDKALAVTMGQAARQARHARQLTQEQVSEQLGVSSEFYSRIERGLAHPSLETLLRMAEVLGVAVDALLGLDAGHAAARASFPLTSSEDPPVVRRLAAELQEAAPSTVRLVRAILGELEELEATRRRAGRGRPTERLSTPPAERLSTPRAEPLAARRARSLAEPPEDE